MRSTTSRSARRGRRRTCPACRGPGGDCGKFRAVKLCQSSSTSGPSATVKPMPDEDVLELLDGLGDEVRWPASRSARTSVRSSRSASASGRAGPRRRARRARSATAARERLAAPRSAPAPTSRRSSGSARRGRCLSPLSADFLPAATLESTATSSSRRRRPRRSARRRRSRCVDLVDHGGVNLAARRCRVQPVGGRHRLEPARCVADAPLARGFEAQDRAGHGHVERLGRPGHRDGDRLVDGGARPHVGQAVGLAAEHERPIGPVRSTSS